MVGTILAAGTSQRLAPYSDEIIPKILLPVERRSDGSMTSLLERLLRQLKEADLDDAMVVCNRDNIHAINRMLKYIGIPCGLVIQSGDCQLDAVCDAICAMEDDKESLLVVDGDNYFFNLREIRDFRYSVDHRAGYTTSVFHARRFDKYAMIEEKQGFVYLIEEKPVTWTSKMIAKGGLLHIPIESFSRTLCARESGKKSTTELLMDGDARIVYLQDEFIDIGTWDDYSRVLKEALRG